MTQSHPRWSLRFPRALVVVLGAAGLSPGGLAAADFEPVNVVSETATLRLEVIGTYRAGIFDAIAAEIAAHDFKSQRLFVVNVAQRSIDVLDILDPTAPALLFQIDLSGFGFPTSVAVQPDKQIVAAAVVSPTIFDPGRVAFFDVDGRYLNDVTVGAVPDMVIFTPDGRHVLAANTAPPDDGLTLNPEGSISILDISQGVQRATVATADFAAFNDQKDALVAAGVRIVVPGATVAQDLQPEFIAVSHDSRRAWVTLEPNNALAVVDIPQGRVTELLPLGLKDHSLPGNELDASDRDGAINIRNWPAFGMYQSDAIAAYRAFDETYLVTANEGLETDLDAFEDRIRVRGAVLDPIAFPDAAELQDPAKLGRLRVSRVGADPDGDGDFDRLLAFGGRSFSIWTADGELVFDSGADFEEITALAVPEYFNTPDERNVFDNRSDDRGPEPEGITTGRVFGRTYAFTVLERTAGVMVYDISDPHAPRFEQYINNRNFAVDPEEVCERGVPEGPDCAAVGDLKPEGVLFIPLQKSPVADPLLVIANEASGSTTLYRIKSLESPERPK